MARTDNTEFVVEVLEGPAVGQSIALSGRQMPYHAGASGSISYGRTQRTKLTWYQGNPIASQQIIGRTLEPTTINGVWKDRYLGTEAAIDLVELFEKLCDSGVQLRVNWETIERRGIVKNISWQPGVPNGGLDSIGWTITFEWNSAGETPIRRPQFSEESIKSAMVRDAITIGQLGQALEGYVDRTSTLYGMAKLLWKPTENEVKALTRSLGPPLVTLSETATRMGDTGQLPSSFIEATTSATTDAQNSAADVADLMSGIFPGHTLDSDSLIDILDEREERDQINDLALLTMERMFETRSRLEDIAKPEEFRTIQAIAGMDLRSVAINYFGTADAWQRIAEYNGIDGSLVPDGYDVISIPLNLNDALDSRMVG